MATEYVHYSVTLWVEVDTDAEEIVSVQVDDGTAALVAVTNPDPDYQKAVEIAEQAEWPEWSTGQ